MKSLHLSKTSWLILSAGVFLVVLAGLGLTRSQQMGEQNKLGAELELSEKTLAALKTAQLSQQLENLKVDVEESQTQLEEAQARLRQTVVSVDVSDELFKIAEYCSVNITEMSTTTISQKEYGGITLSTISLTAKVKGTDENVINYVASLNNDYVTGNLETAQINFCKEETTITMLIYSFEGH